MLNPVPETVLDAERVVNAPVAAVPLPIDPGAANVAPPRVVALLVPLPLTPILQPVPQTIAAVEFVAPVMAEKAVDPLLAATICAQLDPLN